MWPERTRIVSTGRKAYITHRTCITHFFGAQRAVEDFIAVGQTCTTVSVGDVLEKSPSGQVKEKSIASGAEPTRVDPDGINPNSHLHNLP
jgi:hypothetical protein